MHFSEGILGLRQLWLSLPFRDFSRASVPRRVATHNCGEAPPSRHHDEVNQRHSIRHLIFAGSRTHSFQYCGEVQKVDQTCISVGNDDRGKRAITFLKFRATAIISPSLLRVSLLTVIQLF